MNLDGTGENRNDDVIRNDEDRNDENRNNEIRNDEDRNDEDRNDEDRDEDRNDEDRNGEIRNEENRGLGCGSYLARGRTGESVDSEFVLSLVQRIGAAGPECVSGSLSLLSRDPIPSRAALAVASPPSLAPLAPALVFPVAPVAPAQDALVPVAPAPAVLAPPLPHLWPLEFRPFVLLL